MSTSQSRFRGVRSEPRLVARIGGAQAQQPRGARFSLEAHRSFSPRASGCGLNAACRRAAFEAVGGFREDIRAAEDADLWYRLRAAGWELERREQAYVVHLSRQTARALVAQKLGHGAGGAWLDRNYPGSFPARRRPGMLWWGVRSAAKGLAAAAYTRDRDKAIWGVFEPLELLSYEFGRSLRNHPRPRS